MTPEQFTQACTQFEKEEQERIKEQLKLKETIDEMDGYIKHYSGERYKLATKIQELAQESNAERFKFLRMSIEMMANEN